MHISQAKQQQSLAIHTIFMDMPLLCERHPRYVPRGNGPIPRCRHPKHTFFCRLTKHGRAAKTDATCTPGLDRFQRRDYVVHSDITPLPARASLARWYAVLRVLYDWLSLHAVTPIFYTAPAAGHIVGVDQWTLRPDPSVTP